MLVLYTILSFGHQVVLVSQNELAWDWVALEWVKNEEAVYTTSQQTQGNLQVRCP